MVICLERGADLHMAQLMPLPLTVSCFSKIQIGFAFLVPAQPGSPGQRAVKRVFVFVFLYQEKRWTYLTRLLLFHVVYKICYVIVCTSLMKLCKIECLGILLCHWF